MEPKVETEVQVQRPGDALFNKSFEIVKEAMKDVKQELLLTLEDGTNHVVYIHDCRVLNNGQVETDFSTLTEGRQEEIAHGVEMCMRSQLDRPSHVPKKRRLFAF